MQNLYVLLLRKLGLERMRLVCMPPCSVSLHQLDVSLTAIYILLVMMGEADLLPIALPAAVGHADACRVYMFK